MKFIAISFTLKTNNQEKIFKKLKEIREVNKNSILIHGFLPHKVVIDRGFSTEVVDKLDELFPIQLNMWDKKPLREEMAELCYQLDADIYIIGDIVEGVKKELELYKTAGVSDRHINYVSLD